MAKGKKTLAQRIPFRKVIGFIGIVLVLVGYLFLNIDPDTEPALAIKSAFTGMGLIIAGAILSLGALVFAG